MREHGLDGEEILADLERRQGREPSVHGARLFGLVYPTGRRDLEALIEEVNRRYLFGNALNPFKFVELAALEREVIEGVGALLHLPEGGGGTMTSGGTESILMSMLVNRERARARGIERPQILAATSAHPAYAKAAHYFGMDIVRVPLDTDFRADVGAAAELIGPSTAVVIASAFNYPYGIMDPVEQLAALAGEHGIGCHVDACIGGFVLPFLERLGLDVPPWDFPRRGGHGGLRRRAQVRVLPERGLRDRAPRPRLVRAPGVPLRRLAIGPVRIARHGRARPAAPIATAWAALNFFGVDGYTEMMRGLMQTTAKVREGITAIAGLEIVGDPIGPVLSFRSESIDLDAVADVMDDRNWNLNRNTEPRGLHLMLSPAHAAVADELLSDLRHAVGHHGTSRGVEARYS